MTITPINVDSDGLAKTVLAGYYKYGVQTLLTGQFGTSGTIVMEYGEYEEGEYVGGNDERASGQDSR